MKRRLWPRLFRTPMSSLQPERLYAYLDALYQRRNLDGAVLEVGLWLGGTAAIASRFLANVGSPKRYVGIDTFAGFVPEQFDEDLSHGTAESHRGEFAATSPDLVRDLLDSWDAKGVELLQGDIATLPDAELPDRIAVCLIDVDLAVPVYEGLRRIVPRLLPGGLVLVDDCPPEYAWAGARAGYERYMREAGAEPLYRMHMGVVESPS